MTLTGKTTKKLDYETNITTRKIKETIHSFSNDNYINGISYRFPHIWFPALKRKGGPKVNTSSNQNEETSNQSQAKQCFHTIPTLVHKICWPTITLCQLMGEVSHKTSPT